jgi:hypothetical protein
MKSKYYHDLMPAILVLKTHEQRAGRLTQVAEHLSSKCKALSSNPSITKNKKTREQAFL